ncbi:AP2/ERF family transcription factor [Enterococcus gilvus]|uniref:AP2/ERF family transcription factor n=1 Tax=Enterococcus gilvus TaxID=160453 RepID=UPI003D6B352A
MKGVHKQGVGWEVSFSNGYSKWFKLESEAKEHRIFLEKEFGKPKMGTKKQLKNYAGEIFGNYKVIDYAGDSKKSLKQRKVIAKNLITGDYKVVPLGNLINGDLNGETIYVEGTQLNGIKRNNKNKNNKTGVTGVSWNKREQKWVAQIGFKNKTIPLGRFDTKEKAIAARLAAEEKYFKPILEKYENKKENN